MISKEKISSETGQASAIYTEKPCKKLYRKPHLERLSDLRTLTLGGSPGAGDSGNPGVTKPQFPSPGIIPPDKHFPPP